MDFNLSFEQQALVDSLRAFVERELYPHQDTVEELRAVPGEIATEVRRKAREAGFLSMNMPAELGGGGLDYETLALAERELGKPSTALSLLVKRPSKILLACKGEQIERYLMPVVKGDRIDCFALTEPGGAQALAVGDRRHAEGVGVRQGACDAFQAVAVAVGLHHGHDLGAAGQRADARQIGAQRGQMDGGDGGAAHAAARPALTRRTRDRSPARGSRTWCTAPGTPASPCRWGRYAACR